MLSVDALAVQARDDVALLEAGVGRGAVLDDRLGVRGRIDVDPGARLDRQLVVRGDLGIDILVADADPRPRDLLARHHLLDDRLGEVDGQREPDAGRVARDRGVDADDVALGIHERAARVAGVDRSVGLDQVAQVLGALAHLVGDVDLAVKTAHDAGRDGARELAERVAHGDRGLADAQRVRLAERGGRQILAVDLDEREVRQRVDADGLAVELGAVGQDDDHLRGVARHVAVGQDEAVRVDDHARARALRLRRGAAVGRVLAADGDLDGDDRRGELLDDIDDGLVIAGGGGGDGGHDGGGDQRAGGAEADDGTQLGAAADAMRGGGRHGRRGGLIHGCNGSLRGAGPARPDKLRGSPCDGGTIRRLTTGCVGPLRSI
ncbi:MAG: hypothetical protein U0869_22290 [Chloroflexota bacterium]